MSSIMQPVPVPQPQAGDVFSFATEEERVEYLRSIGARNTEPPLPRSTHLRYRKTGRVLPWNEYLAEQRDLVENCDASGNTDPAAWLPGVVTLPENADEIREQMLMDAHSRVFAQASAAVNLHRVPSTVTTEPRSMDYPYGAVGYEDVQTLSPESVQHLADMLNDERK